MLNIDKVPATGCLTLRIKIYVYVEKLWYSLATIGIVEDQRDMVHGGGEKIRVITVQ